MSKTKYIYKVIKLDSDNETWQNPVDNSWLLDTVLEVNDFTYLVFYKEKTDA